METVLAKIVADKRIWIEARKAAQPLASFINEVVPSDRSFYDALSGKPAKFILECKKASPSKGLIRDDFDLDYIASVYGNHAAAISVLTDEKYFKVTLTFYRKFAVKCLAQCFAKISWWTPTKSTSRVFIKLMPFC